MQVAHAALYQRACTVTGVAITCGTGSCAQGLRFFGPRACWVLHTPVAGIPQSILVQLSDYAARLRDCCTARG